MTISCETVVYNGKSWVSDVRFKTGQETIITIGKSFQEVCLYYANVCDYIRCLLGLVCCVVILHAPEWMWTIFWCIFGNVLLDWVDGPLARSYSQSTVIGCGWDWLADILAQFNIAMWCMVVARGTVPTTLWVLFTTVEMATGLFDFAVSATAIYPTVSDTSSLPWYCIVEHWLTPNSSYNHLGTFCWLANTLCPLFYCIEWYRMSFLMVPFAFLYAWHEFSQLHFIVSHWQERTVQLNTKIQ